MELPSLMVNRVRLDVLLTHGLCWDQQQMEMLSHGIAWCSGYVSDGETRGTVIRNYAGKALEGEV